jgi:membrane-associated phospholipid phosphatase
VLYLILRHPERLNRGAGRIYATFDIGLIGYWALPTAPPWYAAAEGYMKDGRTPELRRMMVEYGEQFWRSGWAPLYGVLGGNPLAAMPSLHFATSVTAAHVLAETGKGAALVGWAYTALLGTALVYLGEHYVVDLMAGLALAEGVRAGAPAAEPLARGVSAVVQAIEARARA